jgi:hypothetical protein
MRLFIPEIGTKLKLTQDWTFPLHFETRNKGAFEKLGIPFVGDKRRYGWFGDATQANPVSLPKETLLIVDRIYIRKGTTYDGGSLSQFSSLSFWCQCPGVKGKFRFWAKLPDVNRIECEVQP